VVETIRLESGHTLTGIGGSNPSLSAMYHYFLVFRGCGRCTSRHGNKCVEGEYCSNWFLHKFRHTFATRNLQDHVCDIRTLQLWLGHSDLASTMIYLKAVRNKESGRRPALDA
jgi:integrase